jgi:hypothetical protein
MEDAVVGGRNERRRGRGFGGFGNVWLTGGPHAQNFQPREAPARPIRAVGQGADMGLPALLLGSKSHRRHFGPAIVSPFSLPAPKHYRGRYQGRRWRCSKSVNSIFSYRVRLLGDRLIWILKLG